VLLQDRVDQIEGTMESCRNALMTTLNVMLPRNPTPESLRRLLDKFKSTRNTHGLVKLQVVVGAQFALASIRIWKPKIDFGGMSKGFTARKGKEIRLKKHLEATMEPAKRMINRELEPDLGYFDDHH
jgi:hypothetical protein